MNDLLKTITKHSPHLAWLEKNTVFLTVHGSRAYGTNTETSDYDYKGIAIAPKEYLFSFNKNFEQAELKDPNPDTVIYSIQKFFALASACNPNLIETLHTDPSDHILVTKIGEKILNHKNDFLSKKAKFSFSGYSISQLNRIKLHRRWILNPVKSPPSRKEMGLPEQTLIPQDQLAAANAAIQKELDMFHFDFMEDLDEPMKIGIRNTVFDMLAELKITTDAHWAAAARKVGLSDNFIEIMAKERSYTSAKREYDQYQNWLKTRNPKRAADEAKYGYDCYDEDTEFLTENGFKKFDDVTSEDKLATVYIGEAKHKQHLSVEYQNYTERFDGTFNGNMYNLYGNHINVMVTPNHRMLIQKEERNTGKIYDWSLPDAAHLPDTFNIAYTLNPKIKNYKDEQIFDFESTKLTKENFIKLIGWYLSDGTTAFNSIKTKADDLRISQMSGGKLHSSMTKFQKKYPKISSIYKYDRKPNLFNPKEHVEIVLSVRDVVPDIIYKNCGNIENKRVPRWCYQLSKRLMEMLIDAMMLGDGTKSRPDNGMIYYSSLKGLADDIQELALLCGFETSLYGPYLSTNHGYEIYMYQVHINKTRDRTKKMIRSKNIRQISVENKRIVCFSVPNGTLITRYKGHIGIHGNCKHAYHLVRLLRMAKEMLTTGKVIVKRPDAEELLSIRNGAWTYEQIVDFAETQDKELDGIYKTSTALPHSPDLVKLNKLCQECIEESLGM